MNNVGWWELTKKLGELISPVLGSYVGHIIISDSTSIDFFEILNSASPMSQGINIFILDLESFSTNIFILEGFMSIQRNINRRLLVIGYQSID